jgi:hypothetical protein
MAETVAQLNASVDGLNIAYDEEPAYSHREHRAGNQPCPLEQPGRWTQGKLAQANAWTERYISLFRKQTRIQEELAVIEAKKQESWKTATSVPGAKQAH